MALVACMASVWNANENPPTILHLASSDDLDQLDGVSSDKCGIFRAPPLRRYLENLRSSIRAPVKSAPIKLDSANAGDVINASLNIAPSNIPCRKRTSLRSAPSKRVLAQYDYSK